MFGFNLENGKKQLVQGLICFVATILSATIMALLLAFIKNSTAVIVIAVIFGLATAVLGVLSIIKIIFGAIVYHAERTSSRNTKDIVKDNLEWVRLDENNTTVSASTIKAARESRSPIKKVTHFKTADAAEFIMEDGTKYRIFDVNYRIDIWQKMSKTQLTKLFYEELIKDAQVI